jgi:NAD(P)H-hydrate epimerase|tara:strand:+ start:6025 stop:7404 length:1380 start_codon:yes stop_codon:yes gene_type:complete
VIPVLTPEEMAAVDEAAPEPFEVLVARAGSAVARSTIELLGGAYGRRVVVVAGTGSNGADGRVAAARLRRRGVRTIVLDAGEAPASLPADGMPPIDLVVDAAYGTGLGRPYVAPTGNVPVLAVDLPSGLDGLTGVACGSPSVAERTVTFGALKPGLLFADGPALAGHVEVAGIGLDVSGATVQLVVDADVADLVPARPADAHKWRAACWVVAGSAPMVGAAALAAEATLRAGAGYVCLSVPDGSTAPAALEVVQHPVGPDLALDSADPGRFSAFVVGPGLGGDERTMAGVRHLVADLDRPMVVDGDGLTALAAGDVAGICRGRSVPVVLTPHDGEFERLAGGRPGADRISSVRSLAGSTGAVVLCKGPTTIVASPDGRVRLAATGDRRLASAGTGDVLAGIIGAFLARGADPFDAAAAAAHVHGRLCAVLPPTGVVAGDLSPVLVEVLVDLGIDGGRPI